MTALGIHLFLGPDRARKLQRLHELARALKVQLLDHHVLDAATVPAGELVALCRQHPLHSPAALIVIEQANRMDRPGLDALLAQAALIGRTACVVLLAEAALSERHPLTQLARHVQVEQFPQREVPSAKPFALVEALGACDVAAALGAVQEQLAMGKEPLELLGLIAWQLQRWLVVRHLQEAGCSAEHIGAICQMRPWQVSRLQAEITRRPLDSLQRLLGRCWRLDLEAKSGQISPELAVEQLVLEVGASPA